MRLSRPLVPHRFREMLAVTARIVWIFALGGLWEHMR